MTSSVDIETSTSSVATERLRTWDEAAGAVIDEIWGSEELHYALEYGLQAIPGELLDHDLDILPDAMHEGDHELELLYFSMAATAVQAYADSDGNAAEHFLYDIVLPTLIDRHRKYGPKNITRRKHLGLEVRLSDKVERWKNYERTGKADFSDESLVDVLVDIVGYCAIGLMLLVGVFTLPLEGDSE